jgi:hypothetical protein
MSGPPVAASGEFFLELRLDVLYVPVDQLRSEAPPPDPEPSG